MASTDKAVRQYLEQYADPLVHELGGLTGHWQHVLILPVCGESPDCLKQLMTQHGKPSVLLIVVVNRPAGHELTDQWCSDNQHFIAECYQQSRQRTAITNEVTWLADVAGVDVLLIDHNQQPYKTKEGVGRARKTAADLALALIDQGRVQLPWIFSTDADVELPEDYFQVVHQVAENQLACSLPFHHITDEVRMAKWQAAYDFKMRYYQLGIRCIGASYDYIPLGSTLVVRADAYAKVRGFPVRSGGEDFYLLNKVAKLGGVYQPDLPIIKITARMSERVPFGTGPAVQNIQNEEAAGQSPVYYHPEIFLLIRRWRSQLLAYFHGQVLPVEDHGLNDYWDVAQVLQKSRQQTKTQERWEQFIHEWLDAFRLLKSVHFLREQYPSVPLSELKEMSAYQMICQQAGNGHVPGE